MTTRMDWLASICFKHKYFIITFKIKGFHFLAFYAFYHPSDKKFLKHKTPFIYFQF